MLKLHWPTIGAWAAGVAGIATLIGFVYFSLALLDQAELRSDTQMVGTVSKIQLRGKLKRVDVQEVQQHLKPLLQQDFIALDLAEIRKTLEALPWVREVTVGRKFPDILTVHLVEQYAVARWNNSGFVNRRGEVFNAPVYAESQSLMQLRGVEKRAKQTLEFYVQVQKILADKAKEVRSITQNAQGNTTMVFANGMQVVLGRTQWHKRLLRLKRVLATLQNAKVASIDLRYRKGVAIQWKQEGQHV